MNQFHSPLLDGHLQEQLHSMTQEMGRRLTVTGHRAASISHYSGVHIETIRRIKSGEQASASPRTLDALVIALERLDGETD